MNNISSQLLTILIQSENTTGDKLKAFTANYNKARKVSGLTPVQASTIKRYANGNTGYETGVPAHITQYIVEQVRLGLKK